MVIVKIFRKPDVDVLQLGDPAVPVGHRHTRHLGGTGSLWNTLILLTSLKIIETLRQLVVLDQLTKKDEARWSLALPKIH